MRPSPTRSCLQLPGMRIPTSDSLSLSDRGKERHRCHRVIRLVFSTLKDL